MYVTLIMTTYFEHAILIHDNNFQYLETGRTSKDSMSRSALGPTQPPIQWVPGALSQEVKQPGHEADHTLPSSTKVNNMWRYTSTPHMPSQCAA
jgi:hypothetical protein